MSFSGFIDRPVDVACKKSASLPRNALLWFRQRSKPACVQVLRPEYGGSWLRYWIRLLPCAWRTFHNDGLELHWEHFAWHEIMSHLHRCKPTAAVSEKSDSPG